MCWSLEASILSATFEFIMIGGISIRATSSTNPHVRSQLWLLPILTSIAAIEAMEALLWMDEDNMISVTESSTDKTCSRWNRNLTLAIFLGLLPWQPFMILASARRTGDERNRDLLLAPELLALFYATTFVGAHLVTSTLPFIDDFASNNLLLLPRMPPLRSLESTNYTSCFHTTTCTYIGFHGRLHWALGAPETYVSPNIYTYALLWLPVAVARPRRLCAGLWMSLWVVGIGWLVYYAFSFESGSVWCWSGIAACIYVALQPYLLPCHGDRRKDETKPKKNV
ncbi:hypothetical protein ACHAWF_017459 [Thalassiosira exigua]